MEEHPFVGSAGRTAPMEVLHNVPSGLKGDQVRAGRHRRRLMNCCARMEVFAVPHAHRHSRTAAGADQAGTRAPPRIPRQSPRFRVNPAQDLGFCIRPDLDCAVVVEPVVEYAPGMTSRYVGDAVVVEIRTLNQKDGYRQESRLDMASQRGRNRLGVPKIR